MDGTLARWRIRFRGQVQHVGFRYTAYYLAKKLDVTGWAANLTDGTVLVEAQGAPPRLRQLLIRLKSQPHIHIEKAEITVVPPQPYERGFTVKAAR